MADNLEDKKKSLANLMNKVRLSKMVQSFLKNVRNQHKKAISRKLFLI